MQQYEKKQKISSFFSVFKIIVGDEQDQQKYIKRIKNALLALVLILTCVNIGNTVLNYFSSNDETSTFSIGSIENTDIQLEDVNGGINLIATEAKTLLN